MPVDLLLLRGGVLMELCGVDLAEGSYQQVRLSFAPNEGPAPPLRNSVTDPAGVESPLGVPVAGAKVVHRFTVAPGTRLDLFLDLNPAASVRRDPEGDWTMDPWITARSSPRRAREGNYHHVGIPQRKRPPGGSGDAERIS